jgi:hypothetical protein
LLRRVLLQGYANAGAFILTGSLLAQEIVSQA